MEWHYPFICLLYVIYGDCEMVLSNNNNNNNNNNNVALDKNNNRSKLQTRVKTTVQDKNNSYCIFVSISPRNLTLSTKTSVQESL
jgi:hypothetical protein